MIIIMFNIYVLVSRANAIFSYMENKYLLMDFEILNFISPDLPHQVVSSSRPVEEGLYWGYRVRYASSLSAVFKESSYEVYDHTSP